MLGAPESVFQKPTPKLIKPSLEAFHHRDYDLALKRISNLLRTNALIGKEEIKGHQLKDLIVQLQESLAHDIDKVRQLIAAGKFFDANLDLPQLGGLLKPGDPGLSEIQEELTTSKALSAISEGKRTYQLQQKAMSFNALIPKSTTEELNEWKPLVSQSEYGLLPFGTNKGTDEIPSNVHLKVFESIEQAPMDWTRLGFDDRSWTKTSLPMSWHINHTALFRIPFEIVSVDRVKALRIKNWSFRQQNMKMYINGTLVAKITNAAAESKLIIPLTQVAIKALTQGRNILAATYQHNWRWGRYGRHIELPKSSNIYNSGISVLLDMQEK